MTPASSFTQNDYIDQLPLAHLYAEEEAFIYPLREYLESHGCTVKINEETTVRETYCIIAGSTGYVKSIFASKKIGALRMMGIVITSDPTEGQTLIDDSRKIVVIDPRYLSQKDVDEIFLFFFSSSQSLINLTRNIHEPTGPILTAPSDAHPLQNSIELSPKKIPVEIISSEKLSHEDSQRIKNIMSDVFGGEETYLNRKYKKEAHKIVNKTIYSLAVTTLFILGVVVFPLSSYFGSISIAAYFISTAATAIEKSDIQNAESSLSRGRYWLTQGSVIFSIAKIPLIFFGATTPARGQERLISLLTDLALGMTESIEIVKQGKNVSQLLISTSIRDDAALPASSIEALRISVVSAHGTLGLSQAELSALLREGSFPFSISFISDKSREILNKLQVARRTLAFVENVLTVYPKISGFKQTQSYLVLLQNSNELRPTGGFIGSIGLGTFENGRVSDFAIEDVYALDGQLKGHVDPPRPIAELLGNEHWYLRDSNWDPDFKVSAERASWFYEKETGKKVDGVIAINVPVILAVLKATGPIQLPDYSDRITAENFFGKSLYYTQANFFPGSTQKKDFLGSLARAIMTKLMSDRDVDGPALMQAVMKGIEGRDIMVQFQNPQLQTTVEYFGWGGRIFSDSLCRGVDPSRCIADAVLISESNMSVSKVNFFVNHAAKREITFAPSGEISERISYTIGNTVNTEPDPNAKGLGGPYQTYLRFVLPSDSIVNTISLDGVPIPSRDTNQKTKPMLPYIENTDGTEQTRTIGVAISVLPGENKEVQITYSRKIGLPFGIGGGFIDIFWHKHPGLSDIPLQTSVRFPLYWTVSNESIPESGNDGSFIAKEGQFEYNTQIDRDTHYRIKFIQ